MLHSFIQWLIPHQSAWATASTWEARLDLLLWIVNFAGFVLCLTAVALGFNLLDELIEDRINEWDYCRRVRWWFKFEVAAAAGTCVTLLLHGRYVMLAGHGTMCAYLGYVYATTGMKVDPARVHMRRDQESLSRGYTVKLVWYGVFTGLCLVALIFSSVMYIVSDPVNSHLMEKWLQGLFSAFIRY